jgi:hypothetical protein
MKAKDKNTKNTKNLIVKNHKKHLILINIKTIMKQTITQVSEK